LLILTNAGETNVQLSARNLPKVTVQTVGQTNATDVLRAEAVLCTRAAWQELAERVSTGKGKGAAAGAVAGTATTGDTGGATDAGGAMERGGGADEAAGVDGAKETA
jgi:hypothetical protein